MGGRCQSFNGTFGKGLKRTVKVFIFFVFPVAFLYSSVSAAQVNRDRAQRIANNFLSHHTAIYGQRGKSNNPFIIDSELIEFNGTPVAYNFAIDPQGHLLIPHWDEFSAVLLYSGTSAFDPENIDDSDSVEYWIIPVIYNLFSRFSLNSS